MIEFIVGFITGVVSVLVWANVVYGRKAKESAQKLKSYLAQLEQLSDTFEKQKSASDRLAKVREITEKQLNLRAQAEQPQKSGLDGKYKNSLVQEMKQLEEEKLSILKSILMDKLDPEVTILDEELGEPKKMKLSEYLEDMGIYIDTDTATKSPKEIRATFTVYKGGKSDEPTSH